MPFQKENRHGKGRPKGARNKLSTDFINGLHVAFSKGGIKAIEKIAKTNPRAFCYLIAHLIFKDRKR